MEADWEVKVLGSSGREVDRAEVRGQTPVWFIGRHAEVSCDSFESKGRKEAAVLIEVGAECEVEVSKFLFGKTSFDFARRREAKDWAFVYRDRPQMRWQG